MKRNCGPACYHCIMLERISYSKYFWSRVYVKWTFCQLGFIILSLWYVSQSCRPFKQAFTGRNKKPACVEYMCLRWKFLWLTVFCLFKCITRDARLFFRSCRVLNKRTEQVLVFVRAQDENFPISQALLLAHSTQRDPRLVVFFVFKLYARFNIHRSIRKWRTWSNMVLVCSQWSTYCRVCWHEVLVLTVKLSVDCSRQDFHLCGSETDVGGPERPGSSGNVSIKRGTLTPLSHLPPLEPAGWQICIWILHATTLVGLWLKFSCLKNVRTATRDHKHWSSVAITGQKCTRHSNVQRAHDDARRLVNSFSCRAVSMLNVRMTRTFLLGDRNSRSVFVVACCCSHILLAGGYGAVAGRDVARWFCCWRQFNCRCENTLRYNPPAELLSTGVFITFVLPLDV